MTEIEKEYTFGEAEIGDQIRRELREVGEGVE